MLYDSNEPTYVLFLWLTFLYVSQDICTRLITECPDAPSLHSRFIQSLETLSICIQHNNNTFKNILLNAKVDTYQIVTKCNEHRWNIYQSKAKIAPTKQQYPKILLGPC